MAYVLLVIPNILKVAGINSQGLIGDAAQGLSIASDPMIASLFAATCIISAYGTCLWHSMPNCHLRLHQV